MASSSSSSSSSSASEDFEMLIQSHFSCRLTQCYPDQLPHAVLYLDDIEHPSRSKMIFCVIIYGLLWKFEAVSIPIPMAMASSSSRNSRCRCLILRHVAAFASSAQNCSLAGQSDFLLPATLDLDLLLSTPPELVWDLYDDFAELLDRLKSLASSAAPNNVDDVNKQILDESMKFSKRYNLRTRNRSRKFEDPESKRLLWRSRLIQAMEAKQSCETRKCAIEGAAQAAARLMNDAYAIANSAAMDPSPINPTADPTSSTNRFPIHLTADPINTANPMNQSHIHSIADPIHPIKEYPPNIHPTDRQRRKKMKMNRSRITNRNRTNPSPTHPTADRDFEIGAAATVVKAIIQRMSNEIRSQNSDLTMGFCRVCIRHHFVYCSIDDLRQILVNEEMVEEAKRVGISVDKPLIVKLSKDLEVMEVSQNKKEWYGAEEGQDGAAVTELQEAGSVTEQKMSEFEMEYWNSSCSEKVRQKEKTKLGRIMVKHVVEQAVKEELSRDGKGDSVNVFEAVLEAVWRFLGGIDRFCAVCCRQRRNGVESVCAGDACAVTYALWEETAPPDTRPFPTFP